MISLVAPLSPRLPRNVVYNNIPDCLALTTIDRETLSVPGAPLHTATAKGQRIEESIVADNYGGGGGDLEERVRDGIRIAATLATDALLSPLDQQLSFHVYSPGTRRRGWRISNGIGATIDENGEMAKTRAEWRVFRGRG